MAGIDPDVVAKDTEDSLFERVHDCGEGLVVAEGVSGPARKQRVAAEEMSVPQKDGGRSGCMAGIVYEPDARVTET
jgi:hypothetical protein